MFDIPIKWIDKPKEDVSLQVYVEEFWVIILMVCHYDLMNGVQSTD